MPPLPKPAELQGHDRSLTFNVLFTPGTVVRLLPFSLSLLQSPGIRLRVIANGCDQAEIDVMGAVEESNERVSRHILPSADPVEHGHALNQLFEAFPERHFAFVDSDVIVGGDFIDRLLPLAPGTAGVFADATPVWRTHESTVSLSKTRDLMGNVCTLHDGAFVGNTYCAIYERAALEPVWRAAPRGFVAHHHYMVPESLKESLRARGWHYRTYDTARLVNLQLLLAGFELENREVPEIHHVGAVSGRDFRGSRGGMRRAAAVLRSGSENRPRALVDGLMSRVYRQTKWRPSPGRRRNQQRLRGVVAYVDAVLDAIWAGEPRPPAPSTDSPELDRRIAALVATLETQYPRGVASIREASDAVRHER
jgi:hypothetical protein